jgi:hypothetical protein
VEMFVRIEAVGASHAKWIDLRQIGFVSRSARHELGAPELDSPLSIDALAARRLLEFRPRFEPLCLLTFFSSRGYRTPQARSTKLGG